MGLRDNLFLAFLVCNSNYSPDELEKFLQKMMEQNVYVQEDIKASWVEHYQIPYGFDAPLFHLLDRFQRVATLTVQN